MAKNITKKKSAKKVAPPAEELHATKSVMLTLRIDPEREEDVRVARAVLNSRKPEGSKPTTKSEAISILMSFGMKLFSQTYSTEVEMMKAGKKIA